ncbi:4'-phosphopantetheinyl transferase superfamily protein [Streptomyces sp. A3M-1-3]|uniref:4'-phosphopantetheinyl transferase family protein n=1 Tax=Streptomyces sp. A3M-1-3 TaxID=2962044 RepID=UPI0020B831BC|nr:4'-phosphopantetheinyl transferase superfamily protein [Streptomyces sp. A3M-1-3]MCP3821483.1 4'-phosphopantetheinyl transferase superfamily protein [Streptomyces sp. A3M-1-3]
MTVPRSPLGAEPRLRQGRLDLWLLPQPETAALHGPLALDELDEAERGRADAFRRPADRQRYVVAHIALRRLLAAYSRTAPQDIVFSRAACPRCGAPHGRPVLVDSGVHFSLSHSPGAALIGVALSPVGVDVEPLPRPERVEVCTPALHPSERRELEEHAPGDRPALFARLWARKEAYLKGTGVGVGGWMSDVYLGDEGAHTPSRPAGWTVVDVPCGRDHAAAAAIRGHAPRQVVRRLPPRAVLVGERVRAPSRQAPPKSPTQI